jgi:hypothetical protein
MFFESADISLPNANRSYVTKFDAKNYVRVFTIVSQSRKAQSWLLARKSALKNVFLPQD